MNGQTVILHTPNQRHLAKELIDRAPDCAVVVVGDANRTADQNAKMWAMLSDVSRAKPEGRFWTPDVWKAAFMHSLGHQVRFEQSLDNTGPFPVGFRSSRLNKKQMADLIETIYAYGAEHGVRWSEPCHELEAMVGGGADMEAPNE